MSKSKLIYSFLIVLWMGLVVGVSLFSAPIKFLVPDMSREIQLQLGSLTFRYFNYIEWLVLALILLSLIWLLKQSQLKQPKLVVGLTFLLLLILVADSLYILPVLHNYVHALTNGKTTIDTAIKIAPYHRLYVAGDFLKVIFQLILFVVLNSRSAKDVS